MKINNESELKRPDFENCFVLSVSDQLVRLHIDPLCLCGCCWYEDCLILTESADLFLQVK